MNHLKIASNNKATLNFSSELADLVFAKNTAMNSVQLSTWRQLCLDLTFLAAEVLSCRSDGC